MVELALDSHHSILIESFHTKDSDKRHYIGKCVEDIKKVKIHVEEREGGYCTCACRMIKDEREGDRQKEGRGTCTCTVHVGCIKGRGSTCKSDRIYREF